MQMLYDSDTFVVVHSAIDRADGKMNCFEIVDKSTNREVMLSGEFAIVFQRQIAAWQDNTPEQAEVESALAEYAVLAQLPLVLQ